MKQHFISIALAAVLFMTAFTSHSKIEQLETDTAATDPAIPQEIKTILLPMVPIKIKMMRYQKMRPPAVLPVIRF